MAEDTKNVALPTVESIELATWERPVLSHLDAADAEAAGAPVADVVYS